MPEIYKQFGATVLLVEQNAGLAFAVAQRGYLMNNGQIAGAGPIAEFSKVQLVQEMYLGRLSTSAG